MAQRRMFSKTITNSSRFLKMPFESQALYFQLCMFADDDGVVEAYPVMKMVGCTEDNLKVLNAKNFVRVINDDLVSYINDWNEHNQLRADRKIDSIYKNLLLEIIPDIKLVESRPRTEYSQKRNDVKKMSVLPYSFSYKIKKKFWNKDCPVCGKEMVAGKTRPSIQHNIPISSGGKDELDNISVICHQCNVSIRNKPTGSLNNEEVKRFWSEILGQSNDSPMTAEYRLGKDRLGKDRLDNPETSSDEIPQLIKSFEKINPASKKFYGNSVQRHACQQLIATYGFDRVKKVIEFTLPKTNTMEYMPTITTPLQLFDKWSSLEAGIMKLKNKAEEKTVSAYW